MSELLTYNNILSDIKAYKQSGTNHGSDFNIYDMPSHKYFKILFYFGSNSEFAENTDTMGSGLLAPTWELYEGSTAAAMQNLRDTKYATKEEHQQKLEEYVKHKVEAMGTYYMHNSAWAYLMLNNEYERAEKLEHFITLLSDISTNSPWYFSTLGGISEALDRKSVSAGKLDVSEARKLTIKCLPDAFDNRIGALLDLYRDVTWSWVHKKEIIPANLRKFDMAVYIFETPNATWHLDHDRMGLYVPNWGGVSYKMIEFHDCEIDYNSVKSGFSELDNQMGFAPTYTIDITYNDCYEISYNDIMMRRIGDVILTDLANSSLRKTISAAQLDPVNGKTLLTLRTNPVYKPAKKTDDNVIVSFGNLETRTGAQSDVINTQYRTEYQPGFLATAAGQVAGHLVADVKSLFTRAVLGNIYTYSLTQIKDQLTDAAQGNLIKTGMSVAQYAKEIKARSDARNTTKPTGNIFTGKTIANNL